MEPNAWMLLAICCTCLRELIAAERTGRVCHGLELDPLYIDTAVRRWQLATGKRAWHAERDQPFDALAIELGEAA